MLWFASIRKSWMIRCQCFDTLPHTLTQGRNIELIKIPSLFRAIRLNVPEPLHRFRKIRSKLGLAPFVCRCQLSFCSTHNLSNSHRCTFDDRVLYSIVNFLFGIIVSSSKRNWTRFDKKQKKEKRMLVYII